MVDQHWRKSPWRDGAKPKIHTHAWTWGIVSDQVPLSCHHDAKGQAVIAGVGDRVGDNVGSAINRSTIKPRVIDDLVESKHPNDSLP